MRKLTLSLLMLSLGVALLPLAQATTTPAQEHLLEQVRLGEASNREDLVRQSLYRLELIDPNNPELIAARMRYLLRQGDAAGAQKELERLTKLAPDSPELKASRNEMKSNTARAARRCSRRDCWAWPGRSMKPSPPMKNCTAGCRMTLTSPLNTGRWWRACRPAIAKASAS